MVPYLRVCIKITADNGWFLHRDDLRMKCYGLSFAIWWGDVCVGDVEPFIAGELDFHALRFGSLVERCSDLVVYNVLFSVRYQAATPDSWSVGPEDCIVAFHSGGVVAFCELRLLDDADVDASLLESVG